MKETLETQQLKSSDGTIAHYVNINGTYDLNKEYPTSSIYNSFKTNKPYKGFLWKQNK